MRMPSWVKGKAGQLDLLEPESAPPPRDEPGSTELARAASSTTPGPAVAKSEAGHALLVPLDLIDEDPNNPRTDFPESAITTLADDIRERGILEPIVVHHASAAGRYLVHFGAMRCRAAKCAGLDMVPVVIGDAPADPYAQMAENQKRHGPGQVELKLKTPRRDGTTHLVMSPLEFMQRLAAGATEGRPMGSRAAAAPDQVPWRSGTQRQASPAGGAAGAARARGAGHGSRCGRRVRGPDCPGTAPPHGLGAAAQACLSYGVT